MCNSSRTREHDVLVIGLSGFISVKMFSNGFIFSFKFLSHVINHTLSRFSVSLTVSPCVLLFLSVIIYWGELLTVEFELNLLLVPAPALNFTLLFKDFFFFPGHVSILQLLPASSNFDNVKVFLSVATTRLSCLHNAMALTVRSLNEH